MFSGWRVKFLEPKIESNFSYRFNSLALQARSLSFIYRHSIQILICECRFVHQFQKFIESELDEAIAEFGKDEKKFNINEKIKVLSKHILRSQSNLKKIY